MSLCPIEEKNQKLSEKQRETHQRLVVDDVDTLGRPLIIQDRQNYEFVVKLLEGQLINIVQNHHVLFWFELNIDVDNLAHLYQTCLLDRIYRLIYYT